MGSENNVSVLNLKNTHEDQEKFRTNFGEVEKCFRELKSELYMKRNEVLKLKSELELATEENHKQKASLEKLKKVSEENYISMDIFMRKSQDFEPKYYEKRDALIKTELQYKIAVSKIEVLREELQKVTMEKIQLTRKVNVLEEKQKRDSIYTSDILEKIINVKNAIGTINEDMKILKEEQSKAVELSKQTDLAQEPLQKCTELSKINEKLKQQKQMFEEECIKLRAKCDKMNVLLSGNILTNESNLQTKVLLTQYKKCINYYKETMEAKNNILKNINKALCLEKLTNSKLIQENELLTEKYVKCEKLTEDLKDKLTRYESKGTEDNILCVENPEDLCIKTENESVIEIDSE